MQNILYRLLPQFKFYPFSLKKSTGRFRVYPSQLE
uniref:Uncharacterized protein n=1 Tax=Anguilla anguilla TaxID=7936 RepID=A0A0E9VCU7_ANGAN